MFNIAILNKISEIGLKRFTSEYSINDDIDKSHGILLRSQDINDMVFSSNLLAIARAGAGVNNIPVDRCSEHGIVVFNAPGANANAVKELVLLGMLMSSRNILPATNWVKGLSFSEDNPIGPQVEAGKKKFLGSELAGKTIGVIGLGAIGVLVANTALKLGMKVIGYDPFLTLKAAHELSNKIKITEQMEPLLWQSDFITMHVPATKDTIGMINQSSISKMKDGVVILNFARDTLVNDSDLANALKSEKVATYITDFPNAAVMGMDNVIITPHLGASTAEAEVNCAIMAVDELRDYFENGNISNSVNFPDCSLGRLDTSETSRICILHKNVPAMLGKITGIIAEANINIQNLLNKSKKDYAYTLIDVDSGSNEDPIIEQLFGYEGIICVRVISDSGNKNVYQDGKLVIGEKH